MISVSEATLIFQRMLQAEPRGLSFHVRADRDYPPFHRVMMDGVALRFNEYTQGMREFHLGGVQAAGEKALLLEKPQQALEVMTGAPLPIGADLVIPYEHVKIEGGKVKIIFEVDRKPLENVHLLGSDCKAEEIVLKENAIYNGPHQGILSSMGYEFKNHSGPRILVISTGSELVECDQKPLPHQIRRSNVFAIKSSLELYGFQSVEIDHVSDDFDKIVDHFRAATRHFDILIYSGGVSKGKFDFLPSVWKQEMVKCFFHEVAQRPGKPLWFGKDEAHNTTIVGLPGNPISSLVCLHRYVLSAKPLWVRLASEVRFKKSLTYFLPGCLESRVDGSLWALPIEMKNSGEFTALAETDGFLELPAEDEVFQVGKVFAFWTWRPLL